MTNHRTPSTTYRRAGSFRPRPMLWLMSMGLASWVLVLGVLRLAGVL